MAKVRLVLDNQHRNNNDQVSVKLEFTAKSKKSQVALGVYIDIENWDKKEMTILPNENKFKRKNEMLQDAYNKAEKFVEDLMLKGEFIDDAKYLRDKFTEKDKDTITFSSYFKTYIANKNGRTAEIYLSTLQKIEKLVGSNLRFQEINYSWLELFDKKMQQEKFYNTNDELIKVGLEINGRGIHFRNIRAVFNHAIDNNIIGLELYPFRRFKIKKEDTIKRAIKLEDLQALFNFTGTNQQNWAIDVSKMIFFLIGINVKDLFFLTDFSNETAIYRRAKTNRLYNIYIEPELRVLLDKYKGKGGLSFKDDLLLFKSFGSKINNSLSSICTELKISKITTYSLRHTWATLAGKLDIPDKTIAMALGHGKKTTTDIYIDFDMDKVKKANRNVIDLVLKKNKS